MRWWISQHIVPIYKRLGILGWVRFRILRYAYRIFWWNSPRNGEWDFVLGWLRPIRKFQGDIRVLDVGCTESLLIYELRHRGYDTIGVDQRPYQEPLEDTYILDITKGTVSPEFDYILAVSVVEHIGLGAYGDIRQENGDWLAIHNIHKMLKDDGYFLITIPNKHLGTDTGRGYSYQKFCNLIRGLFKIVYFEERSNQICAVLVKSP